MKKRKHPGLPEFIRQYYELPECEWLPWQEVTTEYYNALRCGHTPTAAFEEACRVVAERQKEQAA